ncbi:MAG: hypothetical protein H0V52_11815 [Acidimicrobiia bacterium]|nr:hypothetical protein [Acidimicrobiia bacterium]
MSTNFMNARRHRALPTSATPHAGVNPMVTIEAIAHLNASRLAEALV